MFNIFLETEDSDIMFLMHLFLPLKKLFILQIKTLIEDDSKNMFILWEKSVNCKIRYYNKKVRNRYRFFFPRKIDNFYWRNG